MYLTAVRTLAFLCIISAATATGPQDSFPYCIPCEDKYLQEVVDISATCDEAPNTTQSSRVTVIGIHGRPLPCVPCHSKFSGRNLTEICNELLPHLQADTTIDEAVEPAKQCSLYNHEVLFKGSCERLLDNSSCPDGQWLVLVKETPMCVEQPCPFGQIIYNGSCVDGRDSSVCGTNQILTTFHDGSADCECEKREQVKDPKSRECQFRQTQGPCADNWYVEKMVDNLAACVPNLCLNDSYVYFDKKCFLKDYQGYCSPLEIVLQYSVVNQDTTAFCRKFNVVFRPGIFSASSLLSCPPGKMKTANGGCSDIFNLKARNNIKTSFAYPELK